MPAPTTPTPTAAVPTTIPVTVPTTAPVPTTVTTLTTPTTVTTPTVPVAGPGGSGRVDVVGDCQTAQYEPTSIVVACADAGIVARALHWTAWGPTSATGSGLVATNGCVPNCAQGTPASYPASVMLSGVASSSAGPVFTTLSVHYDTGGPGGASAQNFSLLVPGSG